MDRKNHIEESLSLWEIYENWSEGFEAYMDMLLSMYDTVPLDLVFDKTADRLFHCYSYAGRQWAAGNYYMIQFDVSYDAYLFSDEMIVDNIGPSEFLYLLGGTILKADYKIPKEGESLNEKKCDD